MTWNVVIPEFLDRVTFSEKRISKFYLWKDKEKLPKRYLKSLRQQPLVQNKTAYCCDLMGNKFLKNTKTAGTPNTWVLNGQELYNGRIDYRKRAVLARFYHDYFKNFILDQLKNPIIIPEGKTLSISCDIYEIQRNLMPDVSNMWLLEKFFEDSLVLNKIIPDDGPKYVTESGRKRYHWVTNPNERKLVFTLKLI